MKENHEICGSTKLFLLLFLITVQILCLQKKVFITWPSLFLKYSWGQNLFSLADYFTLRAPAKVRCLLWSTAGQCNVQHFQIPW